MLLYIFAMSAVKSRNIQEIKISTFNLMLLVLPVMGSKHKKKNEMSSTKYFATQTILKKHTTEYCLELHSSKNNTRAQVGPTKTKSLILFSYPTPFFVQVPRSPVRSS